MALEEWFSLEAGRQLGPFTRGQLVTRLARGAPCELVWRDGLAGWMRPQDVPELAAPPDAPPAAAVPAGSHATDRSAAFAAAFRALARAYGADAGADEDALVFETEHDGIPISVRCEPDADDARIEIRAGAVPYPELSAFLEGGFERLGKRLRLDREVQTGDDDFDGKVYLHTPLPASAVRDIAGRAGFRRGVLALIEQGFEAVGLGDDGLTVSRDVPRVDELARARLDPALSAVALIATSLRGIDPAWSRHRSSSWPLWLAGGAALAAIAGAIGVLAAYLAWEPVSGGLVLVGLAGGGLLWLASVAVLAATLRGRSDALFHLALSGALLLVALPSLSAAGALAVNGAFDRSPPVERQAVVRSKTTTSRRGFRVVGPLRRRHRIHHVIVGEGLGMRRLVVPQSVYERVQRGSTVTLVTRQGALGWEWDEQAR